MAYSEELVWRIRAVVETEPGISERRMFGGLAFLLDGKMAVAATRDGGLMLRVDPAEIDELRAEPHAGPFEMRGREMDGWLRVAAAGLTDDAALRRWIARGLDRARSLPDKG